MLNNIAALVGNGAVAVGDYESIQTVTVGTAQASIAFTSIPSTYKHLQIRSIAQCSTNTSPWQRIVVAFNSDTTNANYADHLLQGNGSTASAVAETSSRKGFGLAAQSGSTYFGANITDVLDYANTNKYKTSRTLRGFDSNGVYTNQIITLESNLWMSTAAISSITLTLEDSSNFNTYSSFALYGVK